MGLPSNSLGVKTKIDFANLLRGFASICVVFSHYTGVFWYRPEVIAQLIGAPVLPRDGFFLTKIAHIIVSFSPIDTGPLGVSVFFLISGFVIPFSVEKLTRLGFFLNRFLRILPTYIFGFGISVVSIYFITFYYKSQFPYSFSNIFYHFLPGLHEWISDIGIDGVIWTLEAEIKFYLIWIIIGPGLVSLKKIFYIALALSLSYLAMPILNLRSLDVIYRHLPFLQYFLIGTVFFLHYNKRISNLYLALSSLALLCLSGLMWHYGLEAASSKVFLNYLIGFLIFSFCYLKPEILKPFSFILAPLSLISYSLYASHSLLGYAVQSLSISWGLGSLGYLLAFLVALIVSSFIFVFIEQPTQNFGRLLGKKY